MFRPGRICAATSAVAIMTFVPFSSVLAADIDFTTGEAPGCIGLSDSQPTGQVFTIPAGETVLRSVTLGLSSDDIPPAGGTLELRRLVFTEGDEHSQQIDVTVIATTRYTVTSVHPQFNLQTLILPGAGLPVTAGEVFEIVAQQDPGGGQCLVVHGDVYTGGAVRRPDAFLLGYDAYFAAHFVSPVPTLSEWAQILLGVLLAGGAAVMIQRRRLAA